MIPSSYSSSSGAISARTSTTKLHARLDDELEDTASRRAANRAAGKGGAETAAGAILGGLLLGPFGAIFGAQMGASVGSARAFDEAKKEEMKRMGVTPEMLVMAQEVGVALERAMEGMKATKNSLDTQQSFARRLEADSEDLYDKAKTAIESGDEENARSLLMRRQTVQERLKKALLACASEKKRLETMEQNVAAIEDRAREMESLLSRSVGAKALQDSSTATEFSLSDEDPLLQKFRDMGID